MKELLDRFIDYLRAEKNASDYTVRNYSRDIGGFFEFLEWRKVTALDEVDKREVRDYTAVLMGEGLARSSIARKLSALRSFFKYLVREELLPVSPLKNAPSPKQDRRLPTFLTTEEMTRLLRAPDSSTPAGQRDRALIELLYASGLRVSEIAGLTRRQIDLTTNEIRVRGKGSKERVVLMGRPAAAALRRYLADGRRELLGDIGSETVFISRSGKPLAPRGVQKVLTKHAKAVGIRQRVHPHVLRHTFATHMLDGGADLRVVQELLGHEDLSSTQIYTHVSKAQARRVYLAAHPLAGDDGDGQAVADEGNETVAHPA